MAIAGWCSMTILDKHTKNVYDYTSAPETMP